MVGQNQKKEITEYDLDQLVQSSFNYGDEQFLEKAQKAEEMIGEDQIPPKPEDGFERLLEKLDERGSAPYLQGRRSVAEEEPEKPRKIPGLHTIFRIAIAAAVIGSVFVMTSVSVGAKKSYEYEAKSQGGEKNRVVINNKVNESITDSLEAAYEEIHKQLGIRVLKMNNKPNNAEYLKILIDQGRAKIYFDIDGKALVFVQQIRTTESSINIVSDRENSIIVYNEWLDKNIAIEKAVTDNGQQEYSATIVDNNGCYYLMGTLDEKTFINIIKDLSYME